MITRFLGALAAGLLVGNILSEALRTGLSALMPQRFDPTLWLGPQQPDSITLLWLLLGWLLSTSASASMASAISGTALAGWLSALCWGLAMLLAGSLAGTEHLVLGAALMTVFAGSLLGNRIAASAADDRAVAAE